MKQVELFANVIAKLQAAGAAGDIDKLAEIIRYHRLNGKLVGEANRVFREAEALAKQPKSRKIVAQGTFARGWEIARCLREQLGGRVSDHFNRGLKLAWQEVKLSIA